MELSFSQFNYEDNLDKQRKLFIDCFPETKGDEIQSKEHYMWKFHSAPNLIQSWEFAAFYNNEITGYYAAIPYKYNIGKRIAVVGMVCDVMTSSLHRGKGIFTKMGKYSTQELSNKVPFTIGFPIRKEVIPGHIKVGWNIPFSMPLYIKFIRLDSLLKNKNLKFLIPFANIAIKTYNYLISSKISSKYSVNIKTDIREIDGYESFTKEWSESVPNSLVKDMPFTVWRYGAPKRVYKFLSITNIEGKLVGFVSFRNILKEGIPSYGILDYMVLPGFKDCHGIINKAITESAKRDNVEAILVMMSKTSALNYKLLRNGYFKSPFSFKLIIKNLTSEFSDEQLFNEKNWHLMWVDTDDL